MSQPAIVSCLRCHRLCEGEAHIALKDGSNFHKQCFTCDLCFNELPLKFALKNGRYYHTDVRLLLLFDNFAILIS